MNLLSHKHIATASGSFFFISSLTNALYESHIMTMYFQTSMWPECLVSAKHKYYDKHNRALWIYKDKPVSPSLSSSWTTHVLWKTCNYRFSVFCFLPSCLTCLLFLKWCLFTNQKSSKSQHTAFVFFIYNKLKFYNFFFMPYALHFMYEYVWHWSEL